MQRPQGNKELSVFKEVTPMLEDAGGSKEEMREKGRGRSGQGPNHTAWQAMKWSVRSSLRAVRTLKLSLSGCWKEADRREVRSVRRSLPESREERW